MTDFRTLNGRTLEQAASDLVAREVLCCMSGVVSLTAELSNMVIERRDQPATSLAYQAAELCAPVLDYEEAAREAGWREAEQPQADGSRFYLSHDFASHETATTWEELCEAENIEPRELEVYEHWAVSQWLGDMLQAKGERVDDDFAGLVVWARTTTGQAISMDAVIQEITRELHLGNAA